MAGKVSIVWKFFKDSFDGNGGMTKFKEEWDKLTDDDKEQLTVAAESESMSY